MYHKILNIKDGSVKRTPMTEAEIKDHKARIEKANRNKMPKLILAKTEETKQQAHLRIIKDYPEHKQRNMLADAVRRTNDYNKKKESDSAYKMPEEDKKVIAKYEAVLAEIERVRLKSNEIEKSFEGMTYEQLLALNVSNDKLWK